MSDAAGRGGGAGKPPTRKFAPNVSGKARKVKTEEGAPGAAGADAAVDNDVFKDLIGLAKTEAGWEKGRGRGRGRGQQQPAFEVTFGAMSDRRQLPLAKSAASGPKAVGSRANGSAGTSMNGAGNSGGGGGAGGSGPSGTTGGGGGGTGAGSSRHGGPDAMQEDLPEGKWHVEDKKKRKPFFDYNSFYPTVLPLRQPAEKESEEDEELPPPVPVDRLTTEDESENTAHTMGLMIPDDTEQMFLMQMPQLLPISGGRGIDIKEEAGLDGGTGSRGPQPGPAARKAAAAAAATAAAATANGCASAGGLGGASPAAAGCSAMTAAVAGSGVSAVGCSLRELPSGKIGKLLVFKSGKVKMQIGDVLMDVSPGLPMQHRMDVAAINMGNKACVILGSLNQRLVVSPDVFQLMADAPVPQYRRDLAPEFVTAAGGSTAAAANGTANGGEANGHVTDGITANGGDVVMEEAGSDDLIAASMRTVLGSLKDVRVKDEA